MNKVKKQLVSSFLGQVFCFKGAVLSLAAGEGREKEGRKEGSRENGMHEEKDQGIG